MSVAALVLAVLGAALLPGDAHTRRLACDPEANTPAVYRPDWIGRAVATVYNGCSSGWQWTLRLKNRAGSTLREDQGYEPIGHYGSLTWLGRETGCAAAYLHTFVYVNNNGWGQSDTGPEMAECAY